AARVLCHFRHVIKCRLAYEIGEASWGRRHLCRVCRKPGVLSKVVVARLLRVGDHNPIGHPSLGIFEHGRFGPWHRDRERFATGGPELDDVGAVGLWAVDRVAYGAQQAAVGGGQRLGELGGEVRFGEGHWGRYEKLILGTGRVSDYRVSVDKFVCAFHRLTLRWILPRPKELIPATSDPDVQTIRTANRRAPLASGFGRFNPISFVFRNGHCSPSAAEDAVLASHGIVRVSGRGFSALPTHSGGPSLVIPGRLGRGLWTMGQGQEKPSAGPFGQGPGKRRYG